MTTDQARELMYKEIDNHGELTHSEVVKASQVLDKKILEDMLILNNEKIRELRSKLDKAERQLSLAKEVVKLYEQGIDVRMGIALIEEKARREGVL